MFNKNLALPKVPIYIVPLLNMKKFPQFEKDRPQYYKLAMHCPSMYCIVYCVCLVSP